MAKRRVKCSQCRQRFELDGAASGEIQCPHCGATLVAPAAPKVAKAAKAARPDPLIGRALGQYEILEVVGRGGMGAVYKARQRSLDRVCAVKVLPRAFASDASFLERFGREARGAAAINHPSVIQVFDVGEEGGFHFIAMEFVDGEHLGQAVERGGPLPPDVALDALKQVASALAAAHELGIVHRDIKPSNIMRTPGGVVKVADFGLAKRSGMDIDVTAPGARLGTPNYMPPEMAHGKPADARSDLYSLGATFYHLLAGRRPFEAKTANLVIGKLLREEPAPLDELAPRCPPTLRRIVERLMARDPDERFQTARELL
ncbi:serine/threonine-protein kinase, partial [Planctomycetota bacterium]